MFRSPSRTLQFQDAAEVLTEIVDTWCVVHQDGMQEVMSVFDDGRVAYFVDRAAASSGGWGRCVPASGACKTPAGQPQSEDEEALLQPTRGSIATKGWRYRVDRTNGSGHFDLLRIVDGELLLLRWAGTRWSGAKGTRRGDLSGCCCLSQGRFCWPARWAQVLLSLVTLPIALFFQWGHIEEAFSGGKAGFDPLVAVLLAPLALDLVFTRGVAFHGYLTGTSDFALQTCLRLVWLSVMLPVYFIFFAALAERAQGRADGDGGHDRGKDKSTHQDLLWVLVAEGLLHTTGLLSHLVPAVVCAAARCACGWDGSFQMAKISKMRRRSHSAQLTGFIP